MSSSSFCVSKLETALGTSLPVDGNGTSVIKGTRRETPYGTLFNVSVHSVDKKGFVTTRYGIPDDDTYLQYPSLFASIPRILVVRVNDDETGSYAVVASGQPKFMAVTDTDNDDNDGNGDNDDNNDDTEDADNTNGAFRIPGVVSYYADEKANGHLIFYRLIPGTRLLLAGTKNYAWLASLDDSLHTIEASSPTAMILDAYAYMFDMLKRDCTDGNVMRVLQTGVTLLGERETNQHLRYYADPGVMFFDASLPPPFKTPHSVGPFAVKDMTSEKLLQLRSGGNSEGWVLRGVNVHGETLVRLKLKTAWYVILRGGRQLFNPADGLDVTLTKWRARMHVQNGFLHIDASYLDTVLFDGYIVPLTKYMYDRGVKKTDICYSGVGFAPVLEAFRRETGINDDFSNLPTMTNSIRVSCHDKRGGGGGGTLIMTACMPPGVGKTTLMMDLAARFGGTHLSQDQFASNRGAFYACLKTRLRAHDTVFLHRCCFSKKDRAGVFTAVRETKSRVFILEAENDAALLYTALRGVVLRGENHETMGKLSDAKRCFIAANFYTKHERVDVATECRGIETALVHNFNMLGCVDLPPHVNDALKGVLDIVGSRDGFNTDDTALTDAQVVGITTLVEAVKTGPEVRHSPSTMASNAELICKSFLSSDLGVSVASVFPSRVRFIAIVLTPESKDKLTRMLSAHVALPVENVIHTGDHVTVAYQPSSSIITLLTPHFNTVNLSMVTKYIRRHKSGGIAATRVVLCDDVHADIRAVMSPHRMAHVTAFYNPATYKAADANRLFIDDDWVTETESFDLTITLQGTLTCVCE